MTFQRTTPDRESVTVSECGLNQSGLQGVDDCRGRLHGTGQPDEGRVATPREREYSEGAHHCPLPAFGAHRHLKWCDGEVASGARLCVSGHVRTSSMSGHVCRCRPRASYWAKWGAHSAGMTLACGILSYS